MLAMVKGLVLPVLGFAVGKSCARVRSRFAPLTFAARAGLLIAWLAPGSMVLFPVSPGSIPFRFECFTAGTSRDEGGNGATDAPCSIIDGKR